MKPKLLINVGMNHCATTPLYYTLSVNQEYCHAGHKKEINYLFMIQENGGYPKYVRKLEDLANADKKKHPILNKYKWDLSEMPEYLEPPYTLEKYIAAKKKDWQSIKCRYESLADWSNSNAALSEDFLTEIKPKLEEHFDVKCVIILRDPIRRFFAFSRTNERFADWMKKINFSHTMTEVPSQFQLHQYHDYAGLCKKWQKIWGDKFMPIIMEELWEDPTNLSKFLDYPIIELSNNVYHPEMGCNYVRHKYLSDQYNPNEDISDSNLKLAKRKMSHVYQAFEEYFGYMPSAWQSS